MGRRGIRSCPLKTNTTIAVNLYDIHTHLALNEKYNNYKSILNIYPLDFDKVDKDVENLYFSCGIHPWYADKAEEQFQALTKNANHDKVVAIGETGLDKHKGPPLNVQMTSFRNHTLLSEQLKKPLIIHAVRAWEEIYHLKREVKPTQPWIIHGFRGNSHIAKQMINAGFLFSIGQYFNKKSLQQIPLEFLFCETDEESISIEEIYSAVADAMNIDIHKLARQIEDNVKRVFVGIRN